MYIKVLAAFLLNFLCKQSVLNRKVTHLFVCTLASEPEQMKEKKKKDNEMFSITVSTGGNDSNQGEIHVHYVLM